MESPVFAIVDFVVIEGAPSAALSMRFKEVYASEVLRLHPASERVREFLRTAWIGDYLAEELVFRVN